jgi:integrase
MTSKCLTSDQITTWGQAVDYTFKTKDTWRHGNARPTNTYNTNHVTNHLGRTFPLTKLTPRVLNDVLIDLETERGMSSSTQNRVISAVSTVLNHCHQMGVIELTPPKFQRRKEGEHRLTWFTKEEVAQMCVAATDPFERYDVADIVAVAAYTGMRQGELMKLTVEDIDLTTGQIYVGGRDGFQTKSKNFRAVPIHDVIRPIIERRSEYANRHVRIFGDEWPGGRDQLLRAFKKVRNYSLKKDDRWTFHSLRHSFATWCAESGVPLRTLMGLLGHSNIETTLRYAKVTDEAKVSAINSI